MAKINNLKLGLNIDHFATLRNARAEDNPNLVALALKAQLCNVDKITIHLREDQRHIKEADLKYLKKYLDIPINLEISLADSSILYALKYLPEYVCLVPENRQEITTEGGLDLKNNFIKLSKSIQMLQQNNIQVSLFIDPTPTSIILARELSPNAIEINTGRYSQAFYNNTKHQALLNIQEVAKMAHNFSINCHAGHGLNYQNIKDILQIPFISEFNIGHSILSYSFSVGLKNAIKKMLYLINPQSRTLKS